MKSVRNEQKKYLVNILAVLKTFTIDGSAFLKR